MVERQQKARRPRGCCSVRFRRLGACAATTFPTCAPSQDGRASLPHQIYCFSSTYAEVCDILSLSNRSRCDLLRVEAGIGGL